MEIDSKMLWAIVPLAIIQLSLAVICLLDWLKRDKFRYMQKWYWLILFLVVNFIGPILYLVFARENDDR